MKCPVCGKEVSGLAVDGVHYCDFHRRVALAILKIPELNKPSLSQYSLLAKVKAWSPKVEHLWAEHHGKTDD